jgi:glycosyltransferase involved in cell wall biosynthesis
MNRRAQRKQAKAKNNKFRDPKALTSKLREKNASKQAPKTLCLTMIVKNEEKNMVRLLDSLLGTIDFISIVDTGSTDNTEEVILTWGKEHDIPTTVHHELFQDFSYNRTHSVKMAKITYPQADYILLSDADFVWVKDRIGKDGKAEIFDKALLVDHKYLVEQFNKTLSYWNIRILSTKVDWECIGVTHEYWDEAKNQEAYYGEVRSAKIHTIAIDDKEDGGCKTDKYVRDEALLRKGLTLPEPRPGVHTRYKFYLAQTLKDMGRHPESIEWYQKRVEDKGWFEEVFYAKFQIGVNYERMGIHLRNCIILIANAKKTEEEFEYIKRWNSEGLFPSQLFKLSTEAFTNAAINYMAAYKYRPSRVESIYYLTKMYREKGMNEMAYSVAMLGKDVEYPKNDTLFIERACYDYLFDYEISIVASYIPDAREEGRDAIARLLDRDDLPDWLVEQTKKNSRVYCRVDLI